jgi:hypothetical protein
MKIETIQVPKYALNKILALSLLAICLFLTLFFQKLLPLLFFIGEKYVSPDHHIGPQGVINIRFYLIVLIAFLLLASLLFYLNFFKLVLDTISRIIDIRRIRSFFLTDKISPSKQLPVWLFLTATLSSLFYHLFYLVYFQPATEGTMEQVSSFLFFISAFLMVVSALTLQPKLFPAGSGKTAQRILYFTAAILLYIYGEEISWGQRFFHFEAIGIFKDYNYQQETNSHNFFNPLFTILYPLVGISAFLGLFFFWFFKTRKDFLFELFIPPQSLFFLVFIMACSSFMGHSEIYEELLAMLVLLYSIRIFVCIRSSNRGFYARLTTKEAP